MSYLSELDYKLKQYYRLKDSVANVVIDITNALDLLETAKSSIEYEYSIDNSSADNYIISNEYKELKNKVTTLKGTVLPAIDDDIARTIREMRNEEDRIAEEKRKEKLEQERLQREQGGL